MKIFAKSWQFLGLEADLVREGDYIADLVAGCPVLVVRDGNGVLHGHHNVCRHRAGPIAGETKGHCDRELVCRFHGWRYDFEGRLIDAVEFGPANGFDPEGLSLFPIRVETWRGLVFVNLDADAASLSELLSPLDERLGRTISRPARLRDRHEILCNWKVIVENYLDGYHQEGIHAALASEGGAQRHDVHLMGDVAIYQGPSESLWAWVWPNVGLSVYWGVLMLEVFRPDGPDRTLVDHVFLYEPEDPGVDAAILNAERITEEDAWLSERVQRNLDAGVFQNGFLSPTHEDAVARFQSRVVTLLNGQ